MAQSYILRNQDDYLFFLGSKRPGPTWNQSCRITSDFRGFFAHGSLQAFADALQCEENGPESLKEIVENYSRRPRSPHARIMGILNVTPDSFSDGGRFLSPDLAIEHGKRLIDEGADIIDIGGESSRPGADPVDEEEELRRTQPVIEALVGLGNIEISIDTTKPGVARRSVEAGARWINDISGFVKDEMIEVAARGSTGVVIMHRQGSSKTMQMAPYYDHLFSDVAEFLSAGATRVLHAGIPADRIYIDPGIGFGKTVEHNTLLISHIDFLLGLGFPICIGASRKSFLKAVVPGEPQERLFPSVTAHTCAILGGASLIRVHDVRPHREMVRTLELLNHA